MIILFNSIARAERITQRKDFTSAKTELFWEQVYQLWAAPSLDPKTPPTLHSTGSAIDLTLVNAQGETLDMGSDIDELSPRSIPSYYANSLTLEEQQISLSSRITPSSHDSWRFSSSPQRMVAFFFRRSNVRLG